MRRRLPDVVLGIVPACGATTLRARKSTHPEPSLEKSMARLPLPRKQRPEFSDVRLLWRTCGLSRLPERARALQALGVAAEECPTPWSCLRPADHADRVTPTGGARRSDGVADPNLRWMNLRCVRAVLNGHAHLS